MKISRIFAHRVELPLVEGCYRWSGGKSVSVFDSTIVGIETECGLIGYGEVCPLGPFYLPAYAEGVRCGLKELGPHLIGYDPRELGLLNHRMDAALKGHPYVKSGIDIACWDILGQATQLPVCTLMGGRFGDSVRLYRAISQVPPDEMAQNVKDYKEAGYTRFQLKVGGDPIKTSSASAWHGRFSIPPIDSWPTRTPVGSSTKRSVSPVPLTISTCTSNNPA